MNTSLNTIKFQFSLGMIALYPGDIAYPENPDIRGIRGGPKTIDAKTLTMEQYTAQFSSQCKNRMEIYGPNSKSKCRIISNIRDPYGHVAPLQL